MILLAFQKGTGFELKITELFRQKGYHVTHNVKLKGKSGAEHQIDVLVEYKAPLHTSRIIIEAKSYQNNIEKDIVMKLIQIQQDVSADRSILATTSDFTPGALQTADQYANLELWDRTKIASFLGEMQLIDTSDGIRETHTNSIKMVQGPVTQSIVEQYGREQAEKRSKGGFMGKGKVEEKFVGATRFLYPYYDVDMEVQVDQVEKTGWRSKEKITKKIRSRTGVDANTGAIVFVTDAGLSYGYAYLSKLTNEEIRLLYYISRVNAFEKRELTALGWTTTKINKVVNSLAGQGVLQLVQARPAMYRRAYHYPSDPSVFVSLMEKYPVIDSIVEERKLEKLVPAASVITAFENYWASCNVLSIDLVYYPYFIVLYERPDGSKRKEVLDGVTGQRQEHLEGVITADIA
jgi:hypothetical protein